MVRRYCPIAIVRWGQGFKSQLELDQLVCFNSDRFSCNFRRRHVSTYHDTCLLRASHLEVSLSSSVHCNFKHQSSFILLSWARSFVTSYSLGVFCSHFTKMSSLNGDFSITEVPAKRSKHLAQQNGSASVEDDDARRFDDLFSELVNDLSGYGDKPSEIVDALRWFKEVNEYNVPHGKKNRGLTVVHSYRYLIGSRCSEESLKLAMVLGWCIEWLQAYFLVSDDIMDSSVTRRGQPCWYKQPKVGLVAINDALYLESAVYFLLKKYFRHLPYYADLVDLFHEVGLQTVIGQNLDLITAPASHVDFASFSLERYNAIVKYKTAFYSFYLPVASALYMAGIDDVHSHSNARTILLKMGEFFQIQDDFLDCYGNPEITGKIGTDIEDNKCSWLIVQALNRASEEQKASLLANYARHDSECVRKVKQIFSELKLPELYAEYEEQSYTSLIDLITSLSGNLPHDMFIAYANKIYKRQK